MRKLPRPLGYHWDQKEAIIHPDGRRGCRWCKRPVPSKRHNWCGDERCLIEWTRRTQPAVFRQVVFNRDHGICASCGLDTRQYDAGDLQHQLYLTRSALAQPNARWQHWNPPPRTDALGQLYPPEHWLRLLDEAIRWRAENRVGREHSPWQVDHIIPICEGGDYFDMSNLRTLCIPCHRAETASLSGRRAERRRESRRPLLHGVADA